MYAKFSLSKQKSSFERLCSFSFAGYFSDTILSKLFSNKLSDISSEKNLERSIRMEIFFATLKKIDRVRRLREI